MCWIAVCKARRRLTLLPRLWSGFWPTHPGRKGPTAWATAPSETRWPSRTLAFYFSLSMTSFFLWGEGRKCYLIMYMWCQANEVSTHGFMFSKEGCLLVTCPLKPSSLHGVFLQLVTARSFTVWLCSSTAHSKELRGLLQELLVPGKHPFYFFLTCLTVLLNTDLIISKFIYKIIGHQLKCKTAVLLLWC